MSQPVNIPTKQGYDTIKLSPGFKLGDPSNFKIYGDIKLGDSPTGEIIIIVNDTAHTWTFILKRKS